MKTKHLSIIPSAVLAGYAFLSSVAFSQPVPPAGLTGTITADQVTVLNGQKPTLKWSVNYPSVVGKVVTIDPDKITPIIPLYADVRVIGQGVTAGTGNGGYIFVPTLASMSIDGGSFKEVFFGTNPSVNPGNIISISNIFGSAYANNLIPAGKALRFGGQYNYNGSLGTYYKCGDGTDNVRFLVNGQTPPTNVPEYNAPSLESFLRPYLDTTGKVKIGPMDVIVFMELTHTAAQKAEAGYDLQDMVLLVTFRNP